MKSGDFLDMLAVYAFQHKGDAHAAEVLMSFLRGECEHLPDGKGRNCQLCGANVDILRFVETTNKGKRKSK